ncbi:MAG: chloride channel protein [Prevotellaceae bacterium]|jgi:CIC family chloride channel protein|nr:chloride channel protein [Prevotellaceae bacterium]
MYVIEVLRDFANKKLRLLGADKIPYILAVMVGIFSGLAAVLLKSSIHLVKDILTGWFNTSQGSLLYLAYPGIGILITIFYVKYFVKDNIGHGITKVLYSISRNNSSIKSHNMYSSMIAGTFTIGFGGSVGAEAPIVLTGSAIGSGIGRFFRLNYRQITLLLGCGAAGAVSGIFKAPLAGIVFTLEILMLDLSMSSIIPLMISSVTACGVSYLLIGPEVEFGNTLQAFAMNNIPYYLLLGICCGFVALYFTRATLFLEKKITLINNYIYRWVAGAVLLGALLYFIPPLYGEGYDVLTSVMTGNPSAIFNKSLFYSLQDHSWFFVMYLLFILVFKVLAVSLTNGSGGVGGTFGPTLFMGGIAGFLVARLINLSGIHQVPESNFALVGMAGMMSGVMQAPLTAIFLIAEITGGYTLLMPLMVVSVTSFITIRRFESYSIYTKRLAEKGDLLTHDKDKAALTLLKVEDLVETDFIKVAPDDTLGKLIKAVSSSKRNIFPVIGYKNHIKGVVFLDDVRTIMFDAKLYANVFVKDKMKPVPDVIQIDESMENVIAKFEKTGAWNLPVVNEMDEYVGFLSKSKIFSTYRELLKELFGEEE